jgi:hypothetical protein
MLAIFGIAWKVTVTVATPLWVVWDTRVGMLVLLLADQSFPKATIEWDCPYKATQKEQRRIIRAAATLQNAEATVSSGNRTVLI